MAAQRANALVILALFCVELGLTEMLNYYSGKYDYSSEGEAEMRVSDTLLETSHVLKSKLPVYCNNKIMKVILPSGLLSQVRILGKFFFSFYDYFL